MEFIKLFQSMPKLFSKSKGNASDSIADIEQIFDKKYVNYCPTFLGSGFFGDVVHNNIGNSIDLTIHNKKVKLNVAIKTVKHSNGLFNLVYVNGNVIIYSVTDITCEAILLSVVSELWYSGVTPHVPFMISACKCKVNRDKQIIVNKSDKEYEIQNTGPENRLISIDNIFSERHGLDNKNKIKFRGQNYWLMPPTIKYSYLNTLYDLLLFCENSLRDNNEIHFMDGDKNLNKLSEDDFISLLDGFFISFLHTEHLIWKNFGINLIDQHANNIFIHWITENSTFGDKSLKNIDHISYKISKNSFIKIKTFGMILKIGDLGSSVMHPCDNVYIISDMMHDSDINYISDELLEKYKNPNRSYIDFIYNYHTALSQKIIDKTIVGQILKTKPFNSLNMIIPTFETNSFPTAYDLLTKSIYFDSYKVNSVDTSKSNLII